MSIITNDRFDGTTPYAGNVSEAKSGCAVSWKAIIAGAVTAVTVSLGLLVFGSGLGLATVSPFYGSDTSGVALGASAIIWLIVMQWLSSGLGGYITGRLRSKWADTQEDEIYFRDTAHGFLAWAVATLITVCFVASAASSLVAGGAKAVGAVAAGAAAGAGHEAAEGPDARGPGTPMDYYVDMMMRSDKPVADAREMRMEASRIFMRDIAMDEFPADDRAYLARALATRNGVSQADASRQVDEAIASATKAKEEAKKAADDARKVAASVSIFSFLSMLVGAFIAAIAAVIGGRHRDQF